MDFNSLIERKRERFEQLEREIAEPALFENRKRASDIMREHSSVKQLLARWTELETARQRLDDNRQLAASNDDEIAAMADDEIPDLQKRVSELERAVELNPKHFPALKNLAVLYEKAGFKHKAVEMWERCVHSAPDADTRTSIKEHLLQLL